MRWRRRVAPMLDEALAADQYLLAEERLSAAGYRHYELSSWARPGRESRHNQGYWARRAYTGIGAGAHSYDGATVRSWNERDLDDYLLAVESGTRPLAGAETLDEPTRAFEAMALGLRRIDGVERAAFEAEFGADPIDRFAGGLADGQVRHLVEVATDRLRLTPAGRLLASEACLAFLPSPA
jgi:oxygen-independent coproporphyrinogen-3 oxidase